MSRSLLTPRRLAHEQAELPPGLYRAKLAEDYDGIGQYVLVNLASSSVSSAYKARIAAGDFGGSRTFPAGTPVHVASYRGQLEVFLGNLPGCIVFDNFDRVESGTWGTPTGQAYPWIDLGSGTPFFVDGEYGVCTARGSLGATQLKVLYQGDLGSDADILFRNGFLMQMAFYYDSPVLAGHDLSMSFSVLDNYTDFVRTVGINFDQTGGDLSNVYVTDHFSGVEVAASIVMPPANTVIRLDWEFIPGDTPRARCWVADDGQPDWQAVSSVPSVGWIQDSWARLRWVTNQSFPCGWHFDYIKFCPR